MATATATKKLGSEGLDGCRVSVIIVSYNTCEMTVECLKSVYEQTEGLDFEVIVVDNQSTDGSADAIADQFPQVRLIRAEENLGFAKANNVAAQIAQGQSLLLLNPDTVILDRAIEKLVEFSQEFPNSKIWGGRTLYGDQSLNPTSCWRRMSPWTMFANAICLNVFFSKSELCNPEAYGDWQRDQVRQVDIITGCFLLIDRDFWNQLDGFDPLFFMYAEEADLCLRAHKIGARPMMTPEATIIHYGGASEKVEVDRVVKIWKGRATLIRRHWSKATAWFGILCLWLIPLTRTVFLRFASLILRKPHLNEKAKMWAGVLRKSQHWLAGYQTRSTGNQED